MKNRWIAPCLLACFSLMLPAHSESGTRAVIGRLEIDQASQVQQGLHHWSGPRDGSLSLDILRGGKTLVLEGTWWDDIPFVQPRPTKINPGWWKMEYGADGIRLLFTLQGQTSAPRCDLYLDFGSHRTNPQVMVLKCEAGTTGILKGVRWKFAQETRATQFVLSLPLDRLVKAPFSLKQTELEVRLYDLDGDLDEYSILADRVPLEE